MLWLLRTYIDSSMLFISLIHSADMLYSLLSEKTKALDYLVFNKLLHYIPFLCSLFSCTQKLCLDFLFHCTFFHWNELKYPSFSADLGLWHFTCILVGAGCFCPVCLCSSINHAFLILLIIYTSFTFILAPSLLLEYLVFCLTFSLLWRTLLIHFSPSNFISVISPGTWIQAPGFSLHHWKVQPFALLGTMQMSLSSLHSASLKETS